MSKKMKLTLEKIKIKSFVTDLTKQENFNLKGNGPGGEPGTTAPPYSSSDIPNCVTPYATVLAGIKGCEIS